MSAASVSERTTTRGRRIGTWFVIALVLLLVGAAGAAISSLSEWSQRGVLDPESAGPQGTRAVVEILREQGVDVRVARSRDDAAELLAAGAATLVLPDAPALSDAALEALADEAADVVLIEPRSRTLSMFLADAAPGGVADGDAVAPACALPAAERAGAITPGVLYLAGDAATACYPIDDAHALLVTADGDASRSAVDGRSIMTNENLAAEGNAALSLALLGQNPVAVWYVPNVADSDLAPGDLSLGELTPPWVSPVIVLLLAAGVAAAIWQGRRFGPLVAERLPVTVRAAETTQGRARLYAQTRDRTHALDELRIAALRRLARALGLGPAASAAEIADAAALRTGTDRGVARGILIDDLPGTDERFVAVAASLRDLEEAVHAAVRPERNTP
ncbi:DUF4350 domain-containing protein [Microbacterium aurantiacum]|uniref:DUF4350 domain-containing protein n=1 Tax=Microbacterium aurantiacum TaxID=162393 RepID=UPI003F496B4B